MHRGLLILLMVGIHSAVSAKDWPQWRGPNANGIADSGDYPVKFAGDEGYLWKAPLPGLGSSTPAIWGDQIFVTAGVPEDAKANDEKASRHDAVISYGMDGKEQWRVLLGPERKGKHRNGSGSNPSPVTDGTHLFAYFKSGTVAAIDYTGKLVWRLNLQELYGEDTLWWDLGSSPTLAGDRLVIAVMQAGDSYLVALGKATGKVVWKTARQYECKKETDQSYATPTIIGEKGKEEILTWGADHLTSHRPSDGKLLWQCGGFNPDDKPMWRVIATPAVTDGIAFVPYGRTKHIAAVKLGGEGDITKTARLWEKEGMGADVPSPLGKDGAFYLLTDNGWLYKFDAKSGDERWKQRLPRSSSKYYASPMLAGETLYCIREDGWVFPLRLKADGFDLLGENDMGERIIASPIALQGKLFIRGAEHLFAIAPSK
jgi:outer membrane protein assembly factor BamB